HSGMTQNNNANGLWSAPCFGGGIRRRGMVPHRYHGGGFLLSSFNVVLISVSSTRRRPSIPRWLRPPAPGACAALVLLGAALLLHFPAWSVDLIPMEDDVKVFYFPLLVATSKALAGGALALWTPSVFGGYPLFADGEAGMLYPLHLLILPWLAPEA